MINIIYSSTKYDIHIIALHTHVIYIITLYILDDYIISFYIHDMYYCVIFT